jgi:antitoxin MazE
MQVSIIQIGNSKGIRLNKMLLEKYQFRDKVELILEKDCIIIKSIAPPRHNWDSAFAAMHQNGEDKLLIDSVLTDENWDL